MVVRPAHGSMGTGSGCATRRAPPRLLAAAAGRGAGLYQVPVFAIEAQGSAAGLASPFCSSSIEMPSGDLMNAM